MCIKIWTLGGHHHFIYIYIEYTWKKPDHHLQSTNGASTAERGKPPFICSSEWDPVKENFPGFPLLYHYGGFKPCRATFQENMGDINVLLILILRYCTVQCLLYTMAQIFTAICQGTPPRCSVLYPTMSSLTSQSLDLTYRAGMSAKYSR